MKIKVLGSGQEVGKSSILVDDKNTKLLLDCGVKINPEPPTYPPKAKVDGIVISHAHLDHSGGAPVYKNVPVFMTDITMELSELLLKDSIKVSKKNGYSTPFSKKDIEKMKKNTKLMNFQEDFKFNNFFCKLLSSGHIPGSSSILIENKKSVFYTADIQTEDSHLLKKCDLPGKIDVLITESTYSYRERPSRKEEEEKFLEHIEEVLAHEEVALIPVFAVGRAQEILLMLKKHADIIALDGMAKKASEIITEYSRYLKSGGELKKVLSKVHFVKSKEQREEAVSKFPIIVTSAGMLGGGPVIHYLHEIKKRAQSKVLFTGFLVEDSPGRNLIKTNVFQNSEQNFHVKCDLQQFELSAHANKSGLFDIIKKTNPEKVVCVHGEKCKEFAQEIKEMGIDAFAPKNNQTINV